MNNKYITLGINNIIKEKFNIIKNNGFIKPSGGLWSCVYTPNDEYISAWENFCVNENFYKHNINFGVIFELKNKAKIYTINSYNDLDNLINNYGVDNLYSFITNKKVIDFEKLSKDYDCLFLSEKGELYTRWSKPYNLYGWDVETMLILNYDVIINQQQYNKKE